jgi:hypothetical protein
VRQPQEARERARQVDRRAPPQLAEQVVPDQRAVVVEALGAQRLAEARSPLLMNGGTRLVPRGAWSTGVPRDDFWLFDDERLWLMDYDPAGGFEAARLVDDPATVARHRHWRDAALTASMSLADYAAVHEPV